MKAIVATVATATALALSVANYWWIGAELARIQKAAGMGAGAANNFGVALPVRLKFQVMLNHFAVNYGYLLFPLIWVLVFAASGFLAPKARGGPGDQAGGLP